MVLLRGAFGRESTQQDTLRFPNRLRIGQRNHQNHATNRVGLIMHVMLTNEDVRTPIGAGDRLRAAWGWAGLLAQGYPPEEIVREPCT